MNTSKYLKIISLPHLFLSIFFSTLWAVVFINSFHNRLDAFPSYVAADLFLKGEYEHIYLPSRNKIEPSDSEYQIWEERRDEILDQSITPVEKRFRGTQYIYHPTYLPLISPIVLLLDIDGSHWLLFFTQIISLLFLIQIICAQLKIKKKLYLFLVYGSFFSYPVLQGIAFGQNTILIPALLLLSLHFANSLGYKALVITIITTTILALIKPWSILLALFVVVASPIKIGIVLLLSLLLAIIILPYLFVPELLNDYFDGLLDTAQMAFVHFENISLLSGLIRIFDPQWRIFFTNYSNLPTHTEIAYLLSFVITIIAGLSLVIKIIKLRLNNADTQNIQALWPLALAASLIPSSVVWAHYYLLAIPLLILQFANSSNIVRILIGLVIFTIGLPILFLLPYIMAILINPQTTHIYLALILLLPIGIMIILWFKQLFFDTQAIVEK